MSQGTLKLVNGSKAVVGTGTNFVNDLTAADFIVITVGGVTYSLVVGSVQSGTGLTLLEAFDGPSTDAAAWTAVPYGAQMRITQQLGTDISRLMRYYLMDKNNWNAVLTGPDDVTVTLPDGTEFTGPSWPKVVSLIASSYQSRGLLDSTTDLNTLLTDSFGIWVQPTDVNATTALHYPEKKAGTMEVLPHRQGVMQRYTSQNNRIYIRVPSVAGATEPFTDWQSVAMSVYSAPGGGTPRDIVDKLVEKVSAQDYGAKGDGQNDDAAAIQKALDTGKTVYLPRGQYVLSKTLIIPDGVTLIGLSNTTSVLKPAAGVNAVRFATGRGAQLHNVGISYPGSTTETGIAVDVPDNAYGVIVEKLFVTACGEGLRVGNCQGSSFSNIDIWFFASRGIHINDNFNDCFFSKIFINGAAVNTATPGQNSIGIYSNGKAHAMMFSDVEVIQCNRPLFLDGTSAASILTSAFSFFDRCYFDSSNNPAYVNKARNITFTACWCSNRATGMLIADSVGISLIGCQLVNNDEHGLVINPGCSFIQVLGSIIDSNGQKTANTYSGIVSNSTSFIDISNNKIGNFGTFPAAQAFAITMLPGTITGLNLCNNHFYANASSPVNRAGSLTDPVISGNQGYRTRNVGNSSLSGSSSVTIAHGLGATPGVKDIQIWHTSGKAGVNEIYVSSTNANTFTISADKVPSVNITIGWVADITQV